MPRTVKWIKDRPADRSGSSPHLDRRIASPLSLSLSLSLSLLVSDRPFPRGQRSDICSRFLSFGFSWTSFRRSEKIFICNCSDASKCLDVRLTERSPWGYLVPIGSLCRCGSLPGRDECERGGNDGIIDAARHGATVIAQVLRACR